MWATMDLLYANPLTLAFHYLLLYFHGSSLDTLQTEFATKNRLNDAYSTTPSSSYHQEQLPVFDFIIVGGGSAGAVLANRLSEENMTVLLVEAGGHPFPLTAVPAFAPALLNNPNIDWSSKIVPQRLSCQALKDKGPMFNRGKLLGGGSNLNAMLYMRGNPNDYQSWANSTDDSSWTYDKLLPYFRKMENYHGHFPDDNYHGNGGPLYVSSPSYAPLQDDFLRAGQEMGYPVKDPNGFQTESVFPYATTTKDGTRFSTHRAYIYPALHRPNLKLQIYSVVSGILFDGSNRAIGVKYVHNGEEHRVKAAKEVILSAGTFGSAQILMLSGIGPADHLKSVGIPLRVDLPVGESLQDHPSSIVGPVTVPKGTLRAMNKTTVIEYINNGTGPYGTVGIFGGAMLASSLSEKSWPDIVLAALVLNISQSSLVLLEKVYNVQEGVLQQYYKSDYGNEGFYVIVTLGRPRSRGTVRLRSASPYDPLIIDPKYFDVPEDLEALAEGAKLTFDLINGTSAFRNSGAKFTSSLFPGCEEIRNDGNMDYWKCYVTHMTHTLWHYTSTCRMGRGEGDPVAVVDSSLRVIGTTGLRVVDASIMPHVTNANTNIPVIMIAEKASDMIKKAWKIIF